MFVCHLGVNYFINAFRCSDCTTATLQNAKSFGSSFFSGDEVTPRLLHNDDSTSLSSAADLEHVGMMAEVEADAEAEVEGEEAIYEEIAEVQQKVTRSKLDQC